MSAIITTMNARTPRSYHVLRSAPGRASAFIIDEARIEVRRMTAVYRVHSVAITPAAIGKA